MEGQGGAAADVLQAGQAALAMMSPEKRKQAIEDALSKATPEERAVFEKQQAAIRKQVERASPEERQQMAEQQVIMLNCGAFAQHLTPNSEAPDAPVGTVHVLAAMAECPAFSSLTEAIKGAPADKQKATVMTFINMEKALLQHAEAADATALRELKCKPEKKRPLLLLLWNLYRHKAGCDAVELDENTNQYFFATKRLATTLLMHAQPLVAQQRWVQQILAVSRVSALLVNELWSHTDEACLEKMRAILAPEGPEKGMPFPELSIKARTSDVTAGLKMAVLVELVREHAGKGVVTDDVADREANPQGILEGYWLYLERVSEEGKPNVLIAAQPLSCKDLATRALKAKLEFEAPKETGEYHLLVHISSTSIVGCDTHAPLSFKVEDDDVPALE